MNLPLRVGHVTAVGLGLILAGCAAATPAAPGTPTPTPTPSTTATASASTTMQDIMELAPLGPIEAGSYFIDPDGNTATPLRVVFDVAAEGWSEWIGAAKFSDVGHVGVSITTVSNLVSDGCTNHMWADPPVGPGVEDLATAMTKLAPFEVTSAPADVTAFGFSGKHLAWIVPDLPVAGPIGEQRFPDCSGGTLKSWVAFIDTAEPGDAFYGYTGPGYREEFWILDINAVRLMIAAEQSADSPPEDLAERDAILESIRIEPSGS